MSWVWPVSTCSGGRQPSDFSAVTFMTSATHMRHRSQALGSTFRLFIHHWTFRLRCFQQSSANFGAGIQARFANRRYREREGCPKCIVKFQPLHYR